MSDHAEHHRDFVKRHGGNPVTPLMSNGFPGGWTLLPSGACVSGDDAVREEPPADPHACLKRRRRYHSERLKRTLKNLQHLEASLRGFAQPFKWPLFYAYTPTTPDDAAAYLTKLREEDEAEIARIDAELGTVPVIR
jgi:hypothetical protein